MEMNPKWTKINKPEFKQELFELADKLRQLVLSTSGSEEGLNVVLTVLATFSCSMNDINWAHVMDTVNKGVIDPNENEIESIMKQIFNGIDKLRTFCPMAKNSNYVVLEGAKTEENITFTFTSKSPKLPS